MTNANFYNIPAEVAAEMSAAMEAAYAAYDEEGAIMGVGPTPEDALNAAAAALDEEAAAGMSTAAMTPALVDLVNRHGGDCGCTRLADGRLGTSEEGQSEA